MINHGQDNYGRDITSESRENGVIRYSVTFNGEGVLFVDRLPSVPFEKVLDAINAHAPA